MIAKNPLLAIFVDRGILMGKALLAVGPLPALFGGAPRIFQDEKCLCGAVDDLAAADRWMRGSVFDGVLSASNTPESQANPTPNPFGSPLSELP